MDLSVVAQVVLMLASGTLYRSMNGGKTFDKVEATAGVYFSSIVRTADERLVRSLCRSRE